MKSYHIIGLLFSVTCLFVSCGQDKPYKPIFPPLKGNVAQIKESTYDAKEKFGEFQYHADDLSSVDIFKYSKEGDLLTEDIYDSDGTLTISFLHEYDNVHRETRIKVSGERVVQGVDRCSEYNQDGSKIISYDFGSKENRDTLFRKESKNGYSFYHSDGSEITRGILDENGWIIKLISFDSAGQEISVNYYEYDENLNNTWEKQEDHSSGSPYIEEYSYKYLEFDKVGNWIKRVKIDDKDDYLYVQVREITYY